MEKTKSKKRKIEEALLRGASIGGVGSSMFILAHAPDMVSQFGSTPVALLIPASAGALAGIEAYRERKKLKKVI